MDGVFSAIASLPSGAGEGLQLVRAVLKSGSAKWRERKVEDMISLPKLDKVSWQVIDQTSVDPKVAFQLTTTEGEGEGEALDFQASRAMLTVLTDSMKRVKDELQSVSES